jgi:hypothetical protein
MRILQKIVVDRSFGPWLPERVFPLERELLPEPKENREDQS